MWRLHCIPGHTLLQGNSRLKLSGACLLEVAQVCPAFLSSHCSLSLHTWPALSRFVPGLAPGGIWESSGLRLDPPLLSMTCVASSHLSFLIYKVGLTSPSKENWRSTCTSPNSCTWHKEWIHNKREDAVTEVWLSLFVMGQVWCVPHRTRLLLYPWVDQRAV